VARSQYRGTLKRRAQVVTSASPLQPGQEVFHDADPGQPAGMVVLSGLLPGDGQVALVELKLASLGSGTLHAGAPDGPALALVSLPYAIPLDAA
jgi:folate-binding Fe-S cluster repair protein YgfZ